MCFFFSWISSTTLYVTGWYCIKTVPSTITLVGVILKLLNTDLNNYFPTQCQRMSDFEVMTSTKVFHED